MISVLLTGGSGFLGRAILKNRRNDTRLSILSRTFGDYKLSLANTVPSFSTSFDVVVHAAGLAHSRSAANVEINNFYSVNVDGTRNLLRALSLKSTPKHFVFISSVAVYGRTSGDLITEDSVLAAIDPYGLSKVAAERLVMNWCQQNGVMCTILRLPLVVGANAPGSFGAFVKSIKDGYYFNIGGGYAKRSMVLVEDVAKVVLQVPQFGGIYNLTDGYNPSFLELSSYVSMKLNKGKPYNVSEDVAKVLANIGELLGRRAPFNIEMYKKMTTDLTFDDSKARQCLGWKPNPVLGNLIL